MNQPTEDQIRQALITSNQEQKELVGRVKNQQTPGEEKETIRSKVEQLAGSLATYSNMGSAIDSTRFLNGVEDILEKEVKAKLAEVLEEIESIKSNYVLAPGGNHYIDLHEFKEKIKEIRTRLGISNHSEHE